MFNLFDDNTELFCSKCFYRDDLCFIANSSCPFQFEFKELQKLCASDDELAGNIDKAAHNDYWAEARYAHACGE